MGVSVGAIGGPMVSSPHDVLQGVEEPSDAADRLQLALAASGTDRSKQLAAAAQKVVRDVAMEA